MPEHKKMASSEPITHAEKTRTEASLGEKRETKIHTKRQTDPHTQTAELSLRGRQSNK